MNCGPFNPKAHLKRTIATFLFFTNIAYESLNSGDFVYSCEFCCAEFSNHCNNLEFKQSG